MGTDPSAASAGLLSSDASGEVSGVKTEVSGPEAAALDRVRTVSRLLDEAVGVPGTDFRIGIDPILGILPVAGDAVAMVLSLYPLLEAARLGVPKRTIAAMLGLVAIDAIAGSIPIIGTVFDAYWKANVWNYRLIERHLGSS